MHIRQRLIGDLYLSSSIIFIYLAFLYFIYSANGWGFLIAGFSLALFGVKTKQIMVLKEKPKKKPKKVKKKK
jgi:hypothetical protein